MNDVNDKLIEGLEEAKKKIADLEDDLATQVGHTEMIRNNHCKVSIVNDLTDIDANGTMLSFDRLQDVPKQVRISDYTYAFIKDKTGFGLWIWNEDDWGEVSDLTMVYMFEYQAIKSYAVAIGWITEEQDLFI